MDLGAVRVIALALLPKETLRCVETPTRSGPGQYALILNQAGAVSVTDGRRRIGLSSGDLTFYDTARPFTVELTDGPPPGCSVIALVPKNLVPVRREQVEPLLVTRFAGDEPMVSLLSRHLQDLLRHADRWSAGDRARLSGATVDLIAALLGRVSASASDAPPSAEPGRLALQNRIHAYIQEHLGDPGLCPAEVAAAHQISVRHLHQLFHEQGLTIAAWIRESRLDRCRRELADAGNLSRPVHAIAARWGFTDAAHFSRLFRSAYGMPPGEYRKALAAHSYPTSAHAPSTTSMDRTGKMICARQGSTPAGGHRPELTTEE